jgi:hypothetical protein
LRDFWVTGWGVPVIKWGWVIAEVIPSARDGWWEGINERKEGGGFGEKVGDMGKTGKTGKTG